MIDRTNFLPMATDAQIDRENALNEATDLLAKVMKMHNLWADELLIVRTYMRLVNQKLNICAHCGIIGGH